MLECDLVVNTIRQLKERPLPGDTQEQRDLNKQVRRDNAGVNFVGRNRFRSFRFRVLGHHSTSSAIHWKPPSIGLA